MPNAERKSCESLQELARRLRAPDGCPWDRRQTLRSLTPYLLEEAHEVIDAVHSGKAETLREELGDLMFIVLFLIEVAEERRLFNREEVVEEITAKIHHRHPHVFQAPERLSQADAHAQWERIKRRQRGSKQRAYLKAGARHLPALLYAYRIQEKAASYGFDWDRPEPIVDKVAEELEEVRQVMQPDPDHRRTGDEIGDLLFAAVNLARRLHQDPERTLRGAVDRFCSRFETMAELMQSDGLSPESADLEILDRYWDRAKRGDLP
ncbi:MAG: nucleoside triphosphate pyrophosphohydrolase [Candidatus Eisenbacteria bacterium]|nr:nucleoside triphosphate pyrophosphohydrolase [Candidatus Eisenbacteria bacterium]